MSDMPITRRNLAIRTGALALTGLLPSLAKAEEALDAVVASLREALAAGESVTFTGFGSFKVVERAARKGRNPRSGAEITIPAAKVAKFTPGKGLKDAIK